jgi:hypothetical protein
MADKGNIQPTPTRKMLLLTRSEFQAKAAYVKDLQRAIVKLSAEYHSGNSQATESDLNCLFDEVERIHAETPEVTTGQGYSRYLKNRVSGNLAVA